MAVVVTPCVMYHFACCSWCSCRCGCPTISVSAASHVTSLLKVCEHNTSSVFLSPRMQQPPAAINGGGPTQPQFPQGPPARPPAWSQPGKPPGPFPPPSGGPPRPGLPTMNGPPMGPMMRPPQGPPAPRASLVNGQPTPTWSSPRPGVSQQPGPPSGPPPLKPPPASTAATTSLTTPLLNGYQRPPNTPGEQSEPLLSPPAALPQGIGHSCGAGVLWQLYSVH